MHRACIHATIALPRHIHLRPFYNALYAEEFFHPAIEFRPKCLEGSQPISYCIWQFPSHPFLLHEEFIVAGYSFLRELAWFL